MQVIDKLPDIPEKKFVNDFVLACEHVSNKERKAMLYGNSTYPYLKYFDTKYNNSCSDYILFVLFDNLGSGLYVSGNYVSSRAYTSLEYRYSWKEFNFVNCCLSEYYLNLIIEELKARKNVPIV